MAGRGMCGQRSRSRSRILGAPHVGQFRSRRCYGKGKRLFADDSELRSFKPTPSRGGEVQTAITGPLRNRPRRG